MRKDGDLVSVVMSVYKTDTALLARAAKSILDQTYSNIEFIIIDDGCDDKCREYLEKMDDQRVKLLHNFSNLGLAASLNKGMDIAKGKYIARMDADDYSLPDRISEQVSYMDRHRDVDVLACVSADIKDGKLTGGIGGAYASLDSDEMRIELSLAPMTFPHPTVMFRTDFLRENNLRYDESFMRSQDYDMWARCSMYGKLDSLQKVLLLYNSDDEKSNGLSKEQIYYSDLTKVKCLMRLIPNPDGHETELYIRMRDTGLSGTVNDNLELVKKLILANKGLKLYDYSRYRHILYFWWGRKMLYAENRRYLADFLKHPGFIVNVVISCANRLPRYVRQYRYARRFRWRVLTEGYYKQAVSNAAIR